MDALFHSGDPDTCPHVPTVDVAQGEVIITGVTARIARLAIPAGHTGTLDLGGGLYWVNTEEAIGDNQPIWFDGVGKLGSAAATAGDAFMGYSVAPSAGGRVLVYHNSQHIS